MVVAACGKAYDILAANRQILLRLSRATCTTIRRKRQYWYLSLYLASSVGVCDAVGSGHSVLAISLETLSGNTVQ